jgi:ABC-type uncharacterized transport system permease subunit
MLLIKYTLLYAMVLMLVALGGCFSEHSGIVNIALEGIMTIGGLVGIAMLVVLPAGTPNVVVLLVSIGAAGLSGILYAALLAFASINLKADQVIGGTALNLLATALAVVIARRFNSGTQSAKLSYSNAPFLYNIGGFTVNIFLFIGIALLLLAISSCPGHASACASGPAASTPRQRIPSASTCIICAGGAFSFPASSAGSAASPTSCPPSRPGTSRSASPAWASLPSPS